MLFTLWDKTKGMIAFHKRLFISIASLFLLFVISVFIFQNKREKKFREVELNAYLTEYNVLAYHSFRLSGFSIDSLSMIVDQIDDCPGLRITVMDTQGLVLFDNEYEYVSSMDNHGLRPEFKDAMSKGRGYSIRYSETTRGYFFYSARRFDNYIVRSALPYDISAGLLQADKQYIYFLLVTSLIVILTLFYYSYRLGASISRLKEFALSAEQGEALDYTETFPDNDIGAISSNIVEIYKRLAITKDALNIERDKLFQHLHVSKEGLAIFSEDWRCIFGNSLFKQYSDFLADSPLESEDQVIFIPELSFVSDFLQEYSLSNSRPTREFVGVNRVVGKNGKTFQVNCILFQDRTFELSISNITQMEEENRIKRQLTQNISHELKTPVSSIRGYLETILESDAEIPIDKQRFFLERCYVQAKRLGELLADISVLNRLDEAANLFDLQKININQLMNDIRKDSLQEVERKGDSVNIFIPQECAIEGNYSLLYSIFRNLLDNAIAYGGDNISINVHCVREDEKFYYFRFSDSGVGVTEDHLNRIFERFYRVDKGRSRKMGGTGLGLAIVKNAVLFHSGEISARRSVSGGLEILFSLAKFKHIEA
ncbi:MAG: sensor histidine kinase [Bacteroidales bacterium]